MENLGGGAGLLHAGDCWHFVSLQALAWHSGAVRKGPLTQLLKAVEAACDRNEPAGVLRPVRRQQGLHKAFTTSQLISVFG